MPGPPEYGIAGYYYCLRSLHIRPFRKLGLLGARLEQIQLRTIPEPKTYVFVLVLCVAGPPSAPTFENHAVDPATQTPKTPWSAAAVSTLSICRLHPATLACQRGRLIFASSVFKLAGRMSVGRGRLLLAGNPEVKACSSTVWQFRLNRAVVDRSGCPHRYATLASSRHSRDEYSVRAAARTQILRVAAVALAGFYNIASRDDKCGSHQVVCQGSWYPLDSEVSAESIIPKTQTASHWDPSPDFRGGRFLIPAKALEIACECSPGAGWI